MALSQVVAGAGSEAHAASTATPPTISANVEERKVAKELLEPTIMWRKYRRMKSGTSARTSDLLRS
ncbi:MAG: hypothetical protein BGO98_08990 [Myxococcales bacterium 68-20]|nr:MAG: hypothetical protein BGO98_08990 [Myxococcales bacterium 68-20]